MSAGQTLQKIEALLRRLHARIRQDRLNLLGSQTTPKVDDPTYQEFWERLASYRKQLEMLRRELGHQGRLLDHQTQAAWNLPRNDPRNPRPGGSPRYREHQRIDSHRQQIARCAELAEQVAAELAELVTDGYQLNDKDFWDEVLKKLDEFRTEQRESSIEARALDHPIIESAKAAKGPTPSLDAWLAMIIAIVMILTRKR